MASTIPPKRCGIASHFFLACLVKALVVSIATSTGESGDLCHFCQCTPSFINCMGVFSEGNILERLSKDEDLTHLNIASPPSKVRSEMFAEHQNITTLVLSKNEISSLDDDFLISFRRLHRADLSSNVFQQIPKLGNNSFLDFLALRANAIQEIPKHLRYDAPNISSLFLDDNYIKVLNGSDLPQRLARIHLSRNKIRALNQDALEGLNVLMIVDLSYNNITFISSYALFLPSLAAIDLAHNRIAVIEPSVFPRGVDSLNLILSGNRLRNLSYLEGLRSLTILTVVNLQDFDKLAHVPKFEGLTIFKADGVRNPEIVSIMLSNSPKMRYLYITNGQLITVNALNHSVLVRLDLSSNRIGLIGKAFSLPSLKILKLRDNCLTSFPNVSGLLYLRVIDVSRNEIVELKEDHLLNLPRLNEIVLDHNKVISVDGHYHLSNLHTFSAAHNQISDIPHSMLLNVKYLSLDGNNMNTFRSSAVTRIGLKFLTLNGNKIDVIDPDSFQYMTVLRILSIAKNKITQIQDLPLFPALTSLTLDNNPLQFIGAHIFLSLPILRTLSLRYTQIATMPEMDGTFPFMQVIDLQKSALVEFPKNISHNFPNLNTMKLNDNMISRWYSGMLTSFSELRDLDISNNPIKAFDIDTSFPPELRYLALGSALTGYISPRLVKSIANLTHLVLKGSRSVRFQDELFCNDKRIELTMDGLTFDKINTTCSLAIPFTLTLSHILLDRSFLDMIFSQGISVFIRNISSTEYGQGDNSNSIVFAKELNALSFTNSRLGEVPRILAPSASVLNLSGNHLTTFSFETIAKFFPSLRALSLSNNRIRVLSSCGMWNAQRNLNELYLDGNRLERFSHWICEDGLVFLRGLQKFDLSNNNISFLSKDLFPPSILKNRYALTIYSHNNPLICTCDQRWLIDVKDVVEVIGGRCVAPQDNKGRELSELMDNYFPCEPLMSDNRICTIAANNTILVECPALAHPNPMVAWYHQEPKDAMDDKGLFTNLSGLSSNCSDAGAEQQALELTLDDWISGDGEQNVLFSLTCLASNIRGSLAIDVSVNITYYDVRRAATPSQRGVNRSLSVNCQAKRHTAGAGYGGCTNESETFDTVESTVNSSGLVKIAVEETSGLFTILCCFLLHCLFLFHCCNIV